MALSAQIPRRDQLSRRRRLRYRVQAPLDVTVLRSGIPDTLPGRLVNLGEGGVGAMLAGELLAGESVGVEIQLPMATDPLRTKALIRHHDKLRYGMEFVGLSIEQQAAIRTWAGGAKAELEAGVRPRAATEAQKSSGGGRSKSDGASPPARKLRARTWLFLWLAVSIFAAGAWWRWNRGWDALEAGLRASETEASQPPLRVPADMMQKLVTHRVDPEYPAAARRKKMRGVIVLDVVVGPNGSVTNVHALNGPEILAQAATDALRWWRFEPYRVDGHPTAVETTVAVDFKE